MSVLKRACARLLSLFWRDGLDREFDEEAQSHLDLAVDDYVRSGRPEAEARRLARMKFGAVESSKDAHRDARGLPRLEALLHDVRLVFRGLRRDWLFTLTAIATLTLAVALNVTVFTVMHAMVFRGLPLVQDNDGLVYMQVRRPSGSWNVGYEDFEAWRSQARSFEGIAFRSGGGPTTFRVGAGRPTDTTMQRVTANTFGLLGVRPMLGRDFTPADDTAGAAPVTILSYRFWESQFGKRADVVGTTVHINAEPATIIGVMPEGFVFVFEQNLWMPLAHTAESMPGGFGGSVFARLRDGATLEGAQAELETINRRLQATDPTTDRTVIPLALTYSQAHIGPDAPMIYGSLWAGSWFVLLIACANLANLALVRTIGRSRELSTRMALGAGQTRVVRQILMEGLAMAGAASVAGWWITTWSIRTWAESTASPYVVIDYSVDSGTLAYLAAISVAAAIVISAAPIVRVIQMGVTGVLTSDARGATQGPRGQHLASVLVTGQMALAIVLLSGAGVLVRSLVNVVGAETGVRNPERILVASMRVPSDRYQGPDTRLAYYDRLVARLKAVPGAEEVSTSTAVPANGGGVQRRFEIEGKAALDDDEQLAQFLTVGSGYFRVVGASAISGRDFNARDQLTGLPVAIVNQRFAATHWPGEDPLGRRLRVVSQSRPGEWRTVIGVVSNIMQGEPLRQEFLPLVYIPLGQEPMARAWDSAGCCFNGTNVLVRTSAPADRMLQAVRTEVQSVDPDVILEEFSTLRDRFAFNRDLMDLAHAELGKHASVAPVFALIALLLAAVGLGAVTTHSVSQRTKEIGIRMAIGAAASDVRRMILREGMTPVLTGTTLGLAASLAANRVLQSQLVGVPPYDPLTMAGAPAVLLGVALLACGIPSQRAMRVDPVVALRHE